MTAEFVAWRSGPVNFSRWHIRITGDAQTLCGKIPEGRVSVHPPNREPAAAVCLTCQEVLKREVTHSVHLNQRTEP